MSLTDRISQAVWQNGVIIKRVIGNNGVIDFTKPTSLLILIFLNIKQLQTLTALLITTINKKLHTWHSPCITYWEIR
jgi:hypothetical protein